MFYDNLMTEYFTYLMLHFNNSSFMMLQASRKLYLQRRDAAQTRIVHLAR